jgi:hypothetical protein
MGGLPIVFVSAFAYCTSANYRGNRDRCLTIKNNYAISIRNHPHSGFEEKADVDYWLGDRETIWPAIPTAISRKFATAGLSVLEFHAAISS